MTLDETTLIQRLTQHDAKVQWFVRMRLPFAVRQLINVDDVMQEIRIEVFRAFTKNPPRTDDGFERWLLSIVSRQIAEAIRQARCHNRLSVSSTDIDESLTELLITIVDGHTIPDGHGANGDAADAARSVLALIPNQQRAVVWLRYVERLSFQEIAKNIGVTASDAQRMALRAREAIENQLGPTNDFFTDVRDDEP